MIPSSSLNSSKVNILIRYLISFSITRLLSFLLRDNRLLAPRKFQPVMYLVTPTAFLHVLPFATNPFIYDQHY